VVRLKVDLIVAWFTPAALAARQATHQIPIVMALVGDPVETGLVASLPQPGGNVTGMAAIGAELAGKLVDVVHELMPAARRIAALANVPDPFSKPFLRWIDSSAAAAGITIDRIMIHSSVELDAAFSALEEERPDALIVQPSLPIRRVAELALRYRVPAVSFIRDFADQGGLLSYGTDEADAYRKAAVYVDKILKGAKPADLPVQQPTKFELVHAVYDKTSWLQERGIEHPWPVAGLPSVLHCDNGAEFHSRALKTACREYGIKLVYRPPATPRFGGHIERLIGTMMGAVHILPGTTFSNTKAREGYASEERAVLSLRELERWLAAEITGVYQRRIHSALLRPPLAIWQESQGGLSFDLPPDRMAFWTSFLPETRRRLLKDGIHLEKIRYWSDVLARDLGRSGDMLIKYDPRDLSRIFVRRPDGSYIEARYRNLAYPAVTIWEWRNAKRRLFDRGKRDLDEDAIFSALALQRRIEMMRSQTALRHVEKRQSGRA